METVALTPKYNLNTEQEKKLILREYRALLRALENPASSPATGN
jgi:GTP pyrophosphokinase